MAFKTQFNRQSIPAQTRGGIRASQTLRFGLTVALVLAAPAATATHNRDSELARLKAASKEGL